MLKLKNFRSAIFTKELILFMAVQFLGLCIVVRSLLDTTAVVTGFRPIRFTLIDLISFLVIIFIFVLVIRKGGRAKNIFFKILFIVFIFSGTQLALSLFLIGEWPTFIALIVIFGLLFYPTVALHNIAMILTLAGIGALIALSLSAGSAIILLVLLSFYDIWAVYKTKHMIALAKGMIDAGAISGFIIPSQFREFFSRLRTVKIGSRAMVLGSGDVLLPFLLVGNAARLSVGAALIVLCFSVIGLWITHLLFFNQLKRQPMAALPPIATLTILGYLLALVII